MAIPLSTAPCWSDLDAEAKRARLLSSAGEVFAREGLDAPMPAIAAAAGAGIGSVYRQFPSKRDLLAALVIERHEEVEKEVEAALGDPGGPWGALTTLLWAIAGRQASDDVLGEAMVTVSEHRDVLEAVAATIHSLEALLDAAKAAGSLRADATALDLRLLFAATRAARELNSEAWRRMLELGIDALRADAQDRAAR
ncbi:MAG TPA: TetR family transcriptional regulator [Solirubrobacterales bacterium]|nr:TetR family transcriptional regulator [Solirubrobacterales bacterium]